MAMMAATAAAATSSHQHELWGASCPLALLNGTAFSGGEGAKEPCPSAAACCARCAAPPVVDPEAACTAFTWWLKSGTGMCHIFTQPAAKLKRTLSAGAVSGATAPAAPPAPAPPAPAGAKNILYFMASRARADLMSPSCPALPPPSIPHLALPAQSPLNWRGPAAGGRPAHRPGCPPPYDGPHPSPRPACGRVCHLHRGILQPRGLCTVEGQLYERPAPGDAAGVSARTHPTALPSCTASCTADRSPRLAWPSALDLPGELPKFGGGWSDLGPAPAALQRPRLSHAGPILLVPHPNLSSAPTTLARPCWPLAATSCRLSCAAVSLSTSAGRREDLPPRPAAECQNTPGSLLSPAIILRPFCSSWLMCDHGSF